MADLKRKTLSLESGKQLKLFGASIAISKSLEIGEGYAPNLFSFSEEQTNGNSSGKIINPHDLNREDLMELADFNIQLWMNLKANVRKFGIDNPKVFNHEAIR
ncbi:MAG TPA: hypothetical protein VM802_30450 [Chitinophaga sp.]|uniref:hypothetical protein n=1 Tax=Chitinophaga sp. TaxID=1869181 RepID=UPI002C56B6E2|nr:hypothetical protein [Chitinophaga sp.]HVI49227.1 hypothetical protein [Chitinophaga sp.]